MREGNQHYKVISLRFGKGVDISIGMLKRRIEPVSIQEEIQVKEKPQQPNFQRMGESRQATTATEINNFAPVKEEAAAPTITNQSRLKERQRVQPAATQQFRCPPPFPQRFQKHKQDKQFGKFFEVLKQLHINIPFMEVLEQMPNYMKFLKDILARKMRLREFEIVAVI